MSSGGCNSVHRLYSLAGPQMASLTVGRTQQHLWIREVEVEKKKKKSAKVPKKKKKKSAGNVSESLSIVSVYPVYIF